MKVLCLWAISYTGASWVGLVAGSRPDALALGNLETLRRRLGEDPERACAIHRARCPLWPAFARGWEPGGDLLAQIGEHTGRELLVVRNPGSEPVRAELARQGREVIDLALVRDPRALAASWLRKNPGRDILDALEQWLLDAWARMQAYRARPGTTVVDHARVAADPGHLCAVLEEATGLAYGERELRFWEHEHHVCSGNAGTFDTVVAYQEGRRPRQGIYARYLEGQPGRGVSGFRDERWRAELSGPDLLAIERVLPGLEPGGEPFTGAEPGREGPGALDRELERMLGDRHLPRIRSILAGPGSERPRGGAGEGKEGIGRIAGRARTLAGRVRRLLSR